MTRKKELMTIFSNPIRQMYTSVVSLWAITAIHHAYEAARYPSLHHSSGLLGIGEYTILLLLTLFLLEGYERTGSLRVYQMFSAVVFLGWVVLVGLPFCRSLCPEKSPFLDSHRATLDPAAPVSRGAGSSK